MLRSYDLDAPADVIAHLGRDALEETQRYATLRQAIECAHVEPEYLRPWIITRDGSILSPRKIKTLRDELLSRMVQRSGRL